MQFSGEAKHSGQGIVLGLMLGCELWLLYSRGEVQVELSFRARGHLMAHTHPLAQLHKTAVGQCCLVSTIGLQVGCHVTQLGVHNRAKAIQGHEGAMAGL